MIRAALTALLLTGCAALDPAPIAFERSTSTVTVVTPVAFTDPSQLGRATWAGATCVVELREYPVCLGHEVDHCFRGQTHTEPSTEGCF